MRLFTRMLLETHNPYKPAVIDWPKLAPEALERVTSLPIWDIAVQTEGRASIRVKTFAETVADPLLREALELDAAEEARHKVVLSKLVEAYGIKLAPEPDYDPPANPTWAWLVTGYSECIDSFFAFGLFETARRSGYFPDELVETFEPVIQEEGASHPVLRQLGGLVSPQPADLETPFVPGHGMRGLGVPDLGADRDRARPRQIGRDAGRQFRHERSSAVGIELSPAELIDLCLVENDRRMAGYDQRLLRPAIVPSLARFARRFMKST